MSPREADEFPVRVGAEAEAARAAVVIVGGHEVGAEVAVDPLIEHGPLLRAPSARKALDDAVHQALDSTGLPVCVVPMTLGRDPRLVADSARTLISLTGSAAAGRVVLAEPFGNPALLTGWLRVAAAGAVGQDGGTDQAVLVTANAANRFDDAELFRIAHLVKVQEGLPQVEVAFRDGGDPNLAEGVDRCRKLGARRVAVIAADFGPSTVTPTVTPMPDVIEGGPLLTPAAVTGVLHTRIAGALHKLGRGDDGIAAGLDADHGHGHGGEPWRDPDSDAG